ncbi:ABC transporter permease [Streptomyces paludis]|uniref:ABC transporter permease n=1 Tax=Streptomyces paludis TaxID=2282738 RepID=UPI001E50C5CE|nr:ABC transporter permease [Streptomyces paludis]
MTAPLTPPHQPPPHEPPHESPRDDPWQTPPDGATPYPVAEADKGADSDFDLKTELRQGVVVLVAVTVVGLLLGLLWVWLAPRVPLISDESAVFLKDTESEEAIAADGTFLLLALGFGALSAVLVFLFHRRGGIATVAGLAVGGVLASVLAWKFGVRLGPTTDVVAHARAVGKGVTFDAPLELQAKGALLAWSVAAMVVHLALTALFGPRDPSPQWEWGPQPAQPYDPQVAQAPQTPQASQGSQVSQPPVQTPSDAQGEDGSKPARGLLRRRR